MAIKKEFLVVLLIGLSVCVTSQQECPPKKDLPDCECYRYRSGTISLRCRGWHTGRTIEDYRKILQKHNFSNLRSIDFVNFNKESRLPSRIFEGIFILNLKISDSNVSRWADEEGGPAFVGLEYPLEELHLVRTIFKPEKRYVEDYEHDKAPMSLGHLRELREVEFVSNRIYNFGNDWFGKGGKSIENLDLRLNRLYFIGDQAFAGLTKLKKISIQQNDVSKVSRSMFPNPAKYLKEIDFLDNKLTALPDDMFINMPALDRVDLQANHITHLPEKIWRPVWSNLFILNLYYNSLVCDEHIKWMFDLDPPKNLWGDCYEPYEFRDVDITQLIKAKVFKKD